MRVLCLFILALLVGAPSAAQQPPPGTVAVETPLSVADNMRVPPRDYSPNSARMLNVEDMFTADHYPALAREREVYGKVTVRLVVGPEGLATQCQTIGKTAPELGGPTCALFLATARFEPARDRRGRAVKSTYTRSVFWTLDALEPLPFDDSTARTIFTFNRDGSIANCRQEVIGAVDQPPEEKAGNPVSRSRLKCAW